MRIISMRSQNLKFALVLLLSVAVLTTLIIVVPDAESSAADAKISYSDIYTNADRVSFISKFGWEVDEKPYDEVSLSLPAEFDENMKRYNDIQLSQGLDLTNYRGKEVVKYTYTVKNFSEYDGAVEINLLVYKNKIVGGDISSADGNGFVCGFSGDKV